MLARAVTVIALLLVPIFAHAAEEIDFGRYHALVIGNNQYEHLADLQTLGGVAVAVYGDLRTEGWFLAEREPDGWVGAVGLEALRLAGLPE